jgi:hypothetical protein
MNIKRLIGVHDHGKVLLSDMQCEHVSLPVGSKIVRGRKDLPISYGSAPQTGIREDFARHTVRTFLVRTKCRSYWCYLCQPRRGNRTIIQRRGKNCHGRVQDTRYQKQNPRTVIGDLVSDKK